MQKVIIDPSIAVLLEIKPIGKSEKRPVIFTAEQPWPGTYSLTVWNSDKKNKEYNMPPDSLQVTENVMTWLIDAETQELPTDKLYAEIYSEDYSSIIYKANFEILK